MILRLHLICSYISPVQSVATQGVGCKSTTLVPPGSPSEVQVLNSAGHWGWERLKDLPRLHSQVGLEPHSPDSKTHCFSLNRVLRPLHYPSNQRNSRPKSKLSFEAQYKLQMSLVIRWSFQDPRSVLGLSELD